MPLGPLDPERGELLRRVVDGLDTATLQWLSGFAAGAAYARTAGATIVEPAVPSAVAVAPRAEATGRLAVVYGSQTGNGRRIAERLGQAAEAAGIAVRVYAARDYPLRDLANERLLTVVVSTHGDGDPPDDARGFIEHLLGKRAPQLPQLKYSVLALGDSTSASQRSVRSDCCRAWTATWTTSGSQHRGSSRSWEPRVTRSAPRSRLTSRGCAACRCHRATAGSVRSRPRCLPTSALPAAVRAVKCATSRSRWRARASSTARVTRSASGTKIRRPWSMPCSKRFAPRARNSWQWTARRAACGSGSAGSARLRGSRGRSWCSMQSCRVAKTWHASSARVMSRRCASC